MRDCAFNPFLPLDVYIPDGEPHGFDGRVYLFGSHDREGGSTFCELDYEFFSAPVDDLSSWSSKGINYSARQDALFTAERPYMYAPDVVRGNDMRDNDAYVNKVLLQREDLNAVIEKVKLLTRTIFSARQLHGRRYGRNLRHNAQRRYKGNYIAVSRDILKRTGLRGRRRIRCEQI